MVVVSWRTRATVVLTCLFASACAGSNAGNGVNVAPAATKVAPATTVTTPGPSSTAPATSSTTSPPTTAADTPTTTKYELFDFGARGLRKVRDGWVMIGAFRLYERPRELWWAPTLDSWTDDNRTLTPGDGTLSDFSELPDGSWMAVVKVDGGLLLATSRDHGATWDFAPLKGTPIYNLRTVAETTSGLVVVTRTEAGIFATRWSNEGWLTSQVVEGDKIFPQNVTAHGDVVVVTAFQPKGDDVFVATAHQSRDGGVTWSLIENAPQVPWMIAQRTQSATWFVSNGLESRAFDTWRLTDGSDALENLMPVPTAPGVSARADIKLLDVRGCLGVVRIPRVGGDEFYRQLGWLAVSCSGTTWASAAVAEIDRYGIGDVVLDGDQFVIAANNPDTGIWQVTTAPVPS